MEIDLLFRIAAVGIIVAVLNLILTKTDHSEQALMVTLGGLVIVLALVVDRIADLFETIRTVFGV